MIKEKDQAKKCQCSDKDLWLKIAQGQGLVFQA